MTTRPQMNLPRALRPWIGLMTLATTTFLSPLVLATGPNLPVRVVRPQSAVPGAFLDFELAVDPGEVLEMSARSTIESKGIKHSQATVPTTPFAQPLSVGSFQAKVPGPRSIVAGLANGVYVQNVDVSIKMRAAGAAAKTLEVRETKYFRKTNSGVIEISSEEYTLAVHPLEQIPGPKGVTVWAHRGSGGRLSAKEAAAATISAGLSADVLLPTPPSPAGGKR